MFYSDFTKKNELVNETLHLSGYSTIQIGGEMVLIIFDLSDSIKCKNKY